MASLSSTLTVQPGTHHLRAERLGTARISTTDWSDSGVNRAPYLDILKHQSSLGFQWLIKAISEPWKSHDTCTKQGPLLLSNEVEGQARLSSQNLVAWTFGGQYDGEKAVLVDAHKPERALSKNKAKAMVMSLTGAFNPGSTVCLHLDNDITYPVLTLAILASGCTWTGTNTAYKTAELEHHFKVSQTRYIITAGEHLDVVNSAVNMAGIPAEIIVFEDLLALHIDHSSYFPSSLRRLSDLMNTDDPTNFVDSLDQVEAESLAFLMQTSGTTGQPKLASRTHRAVMLELEGSQDNNVEKPYEVRRLFCTPIFHAFSAPQMLFNCLRLGQPSYFMKRFDKTFAQKVHDFGITETFGAPPILLMLAQQTQNHHLLQTLRMVAYGGAVLGAEVRQKFLSLFKVKPRLVPVYGMTEGGWFSMLKYPEVCNDGSIGRPVPGVEFDIALSDSWGESSDGPARGELLVRSSQVMEGYFANPDATVGLFINGWLRTGDIGYIKDGKVFVVDRVKDLIKTNGWQVGPGELENALLRSGDVADCAVFGIGADIDERPMACIVASRPGVTEASVKEHLNSCLASYKHNRCEIKFVDSIPKSAAGKILRKVLQEQMEQHQKKCYNAGR
nr:acyl-coa ligase azaf [Quercus suber]